MKIKHLVCQECRDEEKIKTYAHEDAEKLNVRLSPARCSKCGNNNVKLYG